jgi:capsular polysaccharide biosynthesis protein
VLLSIIAGLTVGIAGAFGREYVSRSFRSESDVGRHLRLPLLASIGEMPKA